MHGGHDIEAAAPLGGKNPWLGSFLFGTVENCLWPTLETVHAGSDQGRIHARALPLLWRHQFEALGLYVLGSSWVTTTLQRMPSSCCLRKDLPCALGTIAPMSWRLCGSWKVCGPSGTWNWVRRAQINLHHCSPGETVRGERAKSVAKCCLSVKIVRSCRDIGEMQWNRCHPCHHDIELVFVESFTAFTN